MKKMFFVLLVFSGRIVLCQSFDNLLGSPIYDLQNMDQFTKIKPFSNRDTSIFRTTDGFFKDNTNAYSVYTHGLSLKVNPVIHFKYGKDSRSGSALFENNRGIEIKALIDNKIAVYSMLSENQTLFPDFINQYRDTVGAIPYEGFWKTYGDGSESDFFRAEGYVDVGVSKHVSAQMGFGRHFIGDGQRSLILSDFSNRYPYIRLETEVWKFKYTNIFAQLVGQATFGSTGSLGNEQFPQKFLTMHHLDFKLTDNLNIGFFESVVFGEPDSLGGGVKLQYLNPVIFYRALEQQDGSPDNVIIGMDFNWHIWNTTTLYGQLVIDEMVVSEVLSGNKWVGNKQSFQVGAKYFNIFGINGLNMQGEFNAVRPYTYSHESFFSNYAHYNMPLAHPLGANFREMLVKVDFHPNEKWRFQIIGLFAGRGDDENGLNYGSNILQDYTVRPNEYGNEWLQGRRNNLNILNVRVGYQWKYNIHADIDFIYRDQTEHGQSSIFGFSLRWNFPERYYLF